MSRLSMKDGRIVLDEQDEKPKSTTQKTSANDSRLSMVDGRIVLADRAPVNTAKNQSYLQRTQKAQQEYLAMDDYTPQSRSSNVMEMAINSLRNRLANSTAGNATREWASRMSNTYQTIANETPVERARRQQARVDRAALIDQIPDNASEARRQQWAIDNAQLIDQASSMYEGPTRTERVRGRNYDTSGADMFSNDWEPGAMQEYDYLRTVRNERYNPLSREDRDDLINRYADAVNGNVDANTYQQILYDVTKNGGIEQLLIEQQADASKDWRYRAALNGNDVSDMTALQRLGAAWGNFGAGVGEQIAGSAVGAAAAAEFTGAQAGQTYWVNQGKKDAEELMRLYKSPDKSKQMQAYIKQREDALRESASMIGGEDYADRVMAYMQRVASGEEEGNVEAVFTNDDIKLNVGDEEYERNYFLKQSNLDTLLDTSEYLTSEGARRLQRTKDVALLNEISPGLTNTVVGAGATAIESAVDAGIAAALHLAGGPLAYIPFATRAFGGSFTEATSAMRQAGQELGIDALNKAAMYGGASAAIEVATEAMWGIGGFMGQVTGGGALDEVATEKLTEALKGFAKTEAGKEALVKIGNYLMGGLTEGVEEWVGYTLNYLFNTSGIYSGEGRGEYDWKEVWDSFSAAALSTLISGGTQAAARPVQQAALGRELKAGGITLSDGTKLTVDDMVNLANTPGMEGTTLEQTYSSLFKGMPRSTEFTDRELGQLYEAYEETMGRSEEGAERVQEILSKVENGEELKRSDVNRITNNPDAARYLRSASGTELNLDGNITERKAAVEEALRAFASQNETLRNAMTENLSPNAENANTGDLASQIENLPVINRQAMPNEIASGYFQNSTQDAVRNAAQRMGIGEEGQKIMSGLYSGNRENAIDYVGEMTRPYNLGRENKDLNLEDIPANGSVSAEEYQAAWRAGRLDYLAETARKEINNDRAGQEVLVREGAERMDGQNPVGSSSAVGEIAGSPQVGQTGLQQRSAGTERVYSGTQVGARITESQLNARDMAAAGYNVVTDNNDAEANAVKNEVALKAKKYGINVRDVVLFRGAMANVNGYAERGFFIYHPDGTITIAAQLDNADATGRQIITHEFTHALIKNLSVKLGRDALGNLSESGESSFGTVRDYMAQELGGHDKLVEAVNRYAAVYKAAGVIAADENGKVSKADMQMVFEEMICDFVAGMNAFSEVGHISQAVRSTPVMAAAKKAVEKLANETRGSPAPGAYLPRTPSEQESRYTGNSEMYAIDPNGRKYSLGSLRNDIIDNKFQNDLVNKLGWTQNQVKMLVASLNDLMDFIKPNRDILDLNEEYTKETRPYSPYKPNSDPLYKISLDYSTLCRKRLMTQYIIEKLQLREHRPMSGEEQIAIRDMLKEYRQIESGLQVACAMCYVEAARLKSPDQMNRYFEDPEPVLKNFFAQKNKAYKRKVENLQKKWKTDHGYEAAATKKEMTPADVAAFNEYSSKIRHDYNPATDQADAKRRKEELAAIERAKNLSPDNYLSAENLANLKEQDPLVYDAYTSNIRAATRSKGLETDVPYYYGDSRRKGGPSDKFIKNVNAENGMRFSSWSDFQFTHLLDQMMATIDLSVRKAAMHGYTKFPEQVRIFGRTGAMFNMSGVSGGTGFNADGSLYFSPTESIDFEEAKRLRDQFPDTAGLQCIGINDKHVKALLASDYIDYVIPYHVSGMNAALRNMAKISSWKDYTSTQEESVIDSKAKWEDSDRKCPKDKWHKGPVFSEFFDPAWYTDPAYKGKGVEAMREAAKRYVQMCADRGMRPKFTQFLSEANYWKLLIDRKMVNQKTGDLIQQRSVTPDFDFDVIKKEIADYVAKTRKEQGIEDRALEYISDHWDELPGRIAALKAEGAVEKNIARAEEIERIEHQANVLGSEMYAAAPKNVAAYKYSRDLDATEQEIIAENPDIDDFVAKLAARAEKVGTEFGKKISGKLSRDIDTSAFTESQLSNYNYNQKQTETGSTLKTLGGSAIKRSKYGVGKDIGGRIYMHRDYADSVIPEDVYESAKQALAEAYPDFDYNCVEWSEKDGVVRFDEAPGFDTEREPIVGDYVTVNPDGTTKKGHTDYIWHHKWLWVKDDYKGFDVRDAWEWSKDWLSTISGKTYEVNGKEYNDRGKSDGNGIGRWNAQLDAYGLPRDSAGKFSMDLDEDAAPVRQDHTSRGTSINTTKLPVLYKLADAKGGFKSGTVNIDIGAGVEGTPATAYLAERGVNSLPFDPFNRNRETNMAVMDFLKSGKKADTATCSNVLNVIDNEQARANVILQMAKAIKPDGTAYFTVYSDEKRLEAGKAGEVSSKPDQWQELRAAKTYVPEIKKYFDDVPDPKSGLIIARKPKANLPKATWQITSTEYTDKEGNKPYSKDEAIRFSRDIDSAYMAAAESGDTETAQRLVDEAAEEAMPDSKIRNKNGKLLKVYHGTDADFNVFDTTVSGGKNGRAEGFGIYLSPDQEVTKSYGNRQICMFANITKPAYSNRKTISVTKLKALLKSTCEAEAKEMAEDYGGSVKDALKDTWISNYVDTYSNSMEIAYTKAAQDILRMNGSDMEVIQEVMAGMAIREYADAIAFYNDHLTPVTGFDGFWTEWTNRETGKKTPVILAFNSNQLKVADAITRNDDGNIIPLEERFNPKNDDIRFSRDLSSAYMAAAESGDTETAAKLVKQAAERARYTVNVYHGTTSFGFTQFRGVVFATDSKETAGTYSGTSGERRVGEKDSSSRGMYKLYANTDGMVEFDAGGAETNHIALGQFEADFNMTQDFKSWRTHATINQIIKYAKEAGYSGVVVKNVIDGFTPLSRRELKPATDYVFFNPQAQVKSADPITYDEDGNIIPLEERFNPKNPDIRFSRDLGGGYVSYNDRALISNDTVDYWLDAYAASNPNYAQAYVTYMKPSDFLALTTTSTESRSRIREQSDGLTPEKTVEYSRRQPIQLMINSETGEVEGHEGRHRMVALENAGIKQVPVLLFDSRNKYSKRAMESMLLTGQTFDEDRPNNASVVVDDVQPLSRGNADVVREKFSTQTAKERAYERIGDRQVRFSRDLTNTELYDANRQLQKDLTELRSKLKARTQQRDYWRGQTRVTEGRRLRIEDVTKLAREIIKGQESSADAKAVAEKMKALGEYMLNSQDENVYDEARLKAYEIAHEILSNAKVLNEQGGEHFYKDFRDALKQTPIYVTPSVREEVSPDGWNGLRQMAKGIFAPTADKSKGKTVDVIYHDLQSTFGEWLLPEYVTSEADQLNKIFEVVETYQPVYENINSYDMADATEWTANEILTRIIGEEIRETNPTYADRMEKKLSDQKVKSQEALRRVREQRDRKVQNLKEHYQQVAEDRRNRKIDSEMRTRLLNIAKRLNNKKLDRVQRALLDKYIGDLDLVSKSLTGRTIHDLEYLKTFYEAYKERMGEDFIPDKFIEKKIDRLNKKHISDMTQEEVADLTTVLLNLETLIRTENKLIDSQIKADIYAAGSQTIDDVNNSNGKDTFLSKAIGAETATPERYLHRITGYRENSPLYQAAKELSDGQRKMLDYQMRAESLFLKWTRDKKFTRRIAGKHAEEITISGRVNGEITDVKITPAMRMALYLHEQNDDNMRHISQGGVKIPNMELYKQGKLQEAYDKGVRVVLTRGQVREIVSHMSAEERAFANAVSAYYNGMSRNEINDTSEKLRGYAIAGVEKYYPIDSDGAFLRKEFDQLKRDGTLEGMGILKERIEGASNAIMLYDMNDTLNRSISQHSKYVGLAIPVRNFNRLYGVTTFKDKVPNYIQNAFDSTWEYDTSVIETIQKNWGSTATNYISKMMTDLQNGTGLKDDFWGGLLAKARSHYAGAVLTTNLSVAMKQAASYPTAAAVVGYGPLIKAFADRGKVDLDTLAKYTPLLWYRSKGFVDPELGDIGKEGIHIPKALNWIQGMDVATTTKLVKAAMIYVNENQQGLVRNTDAWWKAVAEVYNRIIEETQPNYTMMQRPQILRSDNALTRALNMFKTQPFQNFNILYDAFGNLSAKSREYKANTTQENLQALKSARANVARAVSSQVVSAFVFALMQFAWDAFRGKAKKYKDDDEEMTFASWLKGMGINVLSSFGGMIPFGSYALELGEAMTDAVLKGFKLDPFFDQTFYGLSENAAESMNDMGNALISIVTKTTKALQGEATTETTIRGLVDGAADIAQFAGMPVSNVIKLAQSIARNVFLATDGQYLGGYKALRVTTDPAKYSSDYYDLLYKAYNKDKAAYEELVQTMIEDGFTEDKIKNAMETRMKKSQGVTSVSDLESRWMSPAQQSTYDEGLSGLEQTTMWNAATDDQQKAVMTQLYNIAIGNTSGQKLEEKIQGGASTGLDQTEYMLYTLALSMVDEPTEAGKYGSYTNDEVEAAILMVPGLSKQERAYLWEAAGKTQKSNPWR